MNFSKENLYKNVFKGDSFCLDSSQNLSPMSSLAHTFFHGASLTRTPTRRMSFSSSSEDSNLSVDSDISVKVSPPSDKENAHYYSPSHRRLHRRKTPLKEVQNVVVNRNLSFSPLKKPVSPWKRQHLSPEKKAPVVEECDSSSRDSGYSESSKKGSDSKVDNVVAESIKAPTRKLNLDISPMRSMRSFSSSFSKEDESFLHDVLSVEDDKSETLPLDLLNVEEKKCKEDENLPNLYQLMRGTPSSSATPSSTSIKPPFRRCLTMIDTTPLTSRVKPMETSFDLLRSSPKTSTPLTSARSFVSFKRPSPPSDLTPSCSIAAKRRRSEAPPAIVLRQNSSPEAKTTSAEEGRPRVQRSHSESHVSIMKALNNSSLDTIGDFSRPLSLPLVDGGKHPDLKSIDVHTMAKLMRGKYCDKVSSFQVLDCRYPYEYAGGHINKAQNWHHPQMVLDHLQKYQGPPEAPKEKRDILIFHCEFSAERGPKAQRLLRESDRSINKDYYPRLHFPEMYLLEGGYKAFFESYPELCSPEDYIRMVDEKHSDEFKFFRSKSKSWTSENSRTRRGGPKRLGS